MDDNRRNRRHYLMGEVLINTSSMDSPIRAVLMNINRGGIGVYAPQALKKKTKVVVRVSYREGTKMKDSEEIPGTVCWSHPVGQNWAAGISFSERVTRRNFPSLSRCLERAKLNK